MQCRQMHGSGSCRTLGVSRAHVNPVAPHQQQQHHHHRCRASEPEQDAAPAPASPASDSASEAERQAALAYDRTFPKTGLFSIADPKAEVCRAWLVFVGSRHRDNPYAGSSAITSLSFNHSLATDPMHASLPMLPAQPNGSTNPSGARPDFHAQVYSKAGEVFDPTKKGGRFKPEFIWQTNWQEALKRQEDLERQQAEYRRKQAAGGIDEEAARGPGVNNCFHS